MAKARRRVKLVLLTLCLTVVLLAGMLVLAPVTVKADISGITSIDFNNQDHGDPLIKLFFAGQGYGIAAGKEITVYDDKGNVYHPQRAMITPAPTQHC